MKKVFVFKHYHFDFWSSMTLLSGILLFIYALLKTFGIINTPPLLENLAYYIASGGLASAAIVFGRILERLDNIKKELQEIKHDLKENSENIVFLKKDVQHHTERIMHLETKIDQWVLKMKF